MVLLLAGGVFMADLPAMGSNNKDKGNLMVQVHGFQNAQGQAAAYLYRAQDKLPGKVPLRKAYGVIKDGQAGIFFESLDFGEYALIVFHDENGNGEPDHNLFRIPQEPIGFSNQFRPGLMSGLPNFEKLRLTFGTDSTLHHISVR